MDGAEGIKIQKLIDDTRKRLVETGTRNRLIHVNRANTRSNVVNVVNERSQDVASLLRSGRAMRFLALGRDKGDADELHLASEDDGEVGGDRYTDNHLETRMGPDSLAKRLLKIAREAQTAEEEQGINILYLALGFVTWFEDKNSAVAREAPLVLLPVKLDRNQKTSTYDLRLRDDDMVTNLPLQQRWQDDFGLKLPEIESLEDDWTPEAYFQLVEEVVSNRPGWKIDRNAIQLGFFSFAKIMMYKDLELKAWPENALETHGLTRGLLYEGYGRDEPTFAAQDRLDAVLPPEKILHVVDADASQAKVIEEVRSGRNLVVQGPPGTGKSQTITNILATAAWEGKTVLFVAEKMAALSVVHDRLVKVGLRDLTLELHSKTANKKAVLAELGRTLAAGQAVPDMPGEPQDLLAARDRLNADAAALHAPIGASGETAFSLLGIQARFMGAGTPPPRFTSERLSDLTRAQTQNACVLLDDYGRAITKTGRPADHPLSAVRRLDIQPVALSRIRADLDKAVQIARDLRAALDAPLAAAALDQPRSLAEVDNVADLLSRLGGLEAGDVATARALIACPDTERLASALRAASEWKTAYDAACAAFVEQAFHSDVMPLRVAIVAGTGSLFARWGSDYRSASRTLGGMLKDALPKRADDRLELVDQLAAVQSLRREWTPDEPFLAGVLGAAWRGEKTAFANLSLVSAWCDKAVGGAYRASPHLLVDLASRPGPLAEMAAALDRARTAAPAIAKAFEPLDLDPTGLANIAASTDLSETAAAGERLALGLEAYSDWTALLRLRAELQSLGLAALTESMDCGELDAGRASVELQFARAEHLWNRAVIENPRLAELRGTDRHKLVRDFAGLERSLFTDNVTAIRSAHLDQLPQGAQGEMAVIRGEIGKRRRHLAIRQLFARAGTALQRVKPVMLMSPISVAQYLTPGQIKFDLLVIDEASQIRPEDALGAIARASQIVVVGDQKQLPPSSFFDRLLADGGQVDQDEDEEGDGDLLLGAASAGEMESILTLCEARGLPSRMLKWHYRSRDPSLMRVSNAEFYDHELVLPPSPLEKDPAYGLIFTRVDGVYDKGGRRDNRIEGENIVRRVAEHAKATPELSLGIVTFSHAQKNAINELLEIGRRSDPALDDFLREGRSEDLFVKNIENVQGDERDVILISVGYGPVTPGGRMIGASFGPVNGEGGERRLNVLFTRARLRCEVFASFDPGDLDVSRAARDGPRILKRYLDYAKSGRIDDPQATGADADSPLEEDVADVIRSLGYLADPQVGSAGFRIDIGVRHPDQPGKYLLAVECDGAAYHSALWARERDRLRQDVLEHLGWRFHRIWSTDWFYNRATEIERLRDALAKAHDAGGSAVSIPGANAGTHKAAASEPAFDLTDVQLPEPSSRLMPAYVRADVPIAVSYEPHETPLGLLAPLVLKIVQIEGPICTDEVARRVASSFGRKSAGSRIVAATTAALHHAMRGNGDLRLRDDFWFTHEQGQEPPVRDRSAESGATAKADALSPMEIRAALRIAEEDSPGSSAEDLVRGAARLMGFRRVGTDLQQRLRASLDSAPLWPAG